ncbi:MAG TPA: hypothetical protein VKC17_03360 [Sphingomicrobium sp.]|nr:hypothetical protein [Sphingomicrobium sp.]
MFTIFQDQGCRPLGVIEEPVTRELRARIHIEALALDTSEGTRLDLAEGRTVYRNGVLTNGIVVSMVSTNAVCVSNTDAIPMWKPALMLFSAFIALGSSGCSPMQMKCQPLMMASKLDGTLRVTVPPGRADEFNRRVVAFLTSKGFSYENSASDTYLGPPDAAGRMATFRNIKTIGCTSEAVVWSENVIRANEFIITFHHTAFGDRSSSTKLMADLAKTARATRSH